MRHFRLDGGKVDVKCMPKESVLPSARYYSFAFKPDQMISVCEEMSSVKKMMLLFGTSQIEAIESTSVRLMF